MATTAVVASLAIGVAGGVAIAPDGESEQVGPGAAQVAVETTVADNAIDDAKNIPDDVIR